MSTIIDAYPVIGVKLDGEYVPFLDVKITTREAIPPAFIDNSIDIELTLANGKVIRDDGGRVEVIVSNE